MSVTIRGDGLTRQTYTVRRREGRWQVVEGEVVLAVCADHNLASAAASRFARAAFNSGVAVRIDTEA